jgi:hypothetical protein
MTASPIDGWRAQRVSEMSPRDGFGVELLDPAGLIVAEAFASDAGDGAFTVSMFAPDVPFVVMEWFLRRARSEIATFTDGRPLPK